ncbi:uracil-DNA glycosylase family protein [Citreimonas salinaria]|uniref:Uracil-DNA glycosylase n=1 Tax=Citreimonas salinaria TaxID=321339 RepID=A0A1H3NR83_9RHOB|nr:uracil-DNA glycosylase family protein [Citreimonas salinaria]SDY90955.1 Uracil-DNA glycosylase [Citreimonas salinaria]
MDLLLEDIRACRLCADRFAATETGHAPRPVIRARPTARMLIAGQAPGMRVHHSGRPFTDPSGDRLRDWLGLDEAMFYDEDRIAIVPMAFCFPGYRKGSDLPPPPICASTWRTQVVASLPNLQLTIPVGSYAQRWHLGKTGNMTETVANWEKYLPDTIPLPHPSWRNTAWLKRNPWFADQLLPALRDRVQEALA